MNEQPTEPTEFHITDEAGANWYARKLAGIEAERARVKVQNAKINANSTATKRASRIVSRPKRANGHGPNSPRRATGAGL